jgi:hypothetical protein
MPGLADKVCVVEAAKEVFENVIDYEKVISIITFPFIIHPT